MTVVPSSMVNSIEDRTKLHTVWAIDTLNSELYSLLWNARKTARFASYPAVEHRPTSLVLWDAGATGKEAFKFDVHLG